jgi:hypothetical protein
MCGGLVVDTKGGGRERGEARGEGAGEREGGEARGGGGWKPTEAE